MSDPRPSSAGFTRHIIQTTTNGKNTTIPNASPITKTATAASSSYTAPTKKLSSSPTPPSAHNTFERMPAPTSSSSSYVSAPSSPFIYNPSLNPPSYLSTPSPSVDTAPSIRNAVKMPKDTVSSKSAVPKQVMTVSPDVDLHAIERKMLDDVGYFRGSAGSTKAQVTVESLLKEKREKDKLIASRNKEMATINSILPIPSQSTTSATAASSSTSSSSLDMSLITSLTSRLSTLEKIANKQAKTLGQKEEALSDMRTKLRSMEHSQDAALMYSLQKENTALQRQVGEMETFLNDYGLVWVGFRAGGTDDSSSGETNAQLNDPDKSPTGSPTRSISPNADSSPNPAASPTPALAVDIYFDVSSFMSSVNELNSVATDGNNLRIHTNTAGVTKFLPPTSLDLILYKDGMWFRGGPLRAWSTKAAREFVKDVMEGYFPYELKEEYPEGVGLAVVDRSKLLCYERADGSGNNASASAASKFTPFAGRGNRLDDGKVIENNTAALVAGSPTSSPSPPVLTSAAPPPLALDSFLAKLPTAVISNGKVIDVRNDIKNMLTGSTATHTPVPASSPIPAASPNASPTASKSSPPTSTSIIVDTPALRLIKSREAALSSNTAAASTSSTLTTSTPRTLSASLPPLPPITTLQVKMDPSDQCAGPLIIKLLFTDTLASLRSFITLSRSNGQLPYELRTNYPVRIYGSGDDARTLKDIGLTPNANLFVRNKRPVSGYRDRQQQADESWTTPINQ